MVLYPMLAIVTVMAAAGPSRTDDPPPIFAKLAFAEAVAKTKSGEKILIVKATAAWCAPCKMMDKTTWRDEQVIKWFDANGIAIQFDVDHDRDLAAKLKIQAMPTMVAFVKGEEFDRVVGYKSAADLLAWAGGVKRGEKSIEAVRARVRAAPKGGAAEVNARHNLAQGLVQSGELDKATEEYAWLWVNSAGVPAYGGVRGSFMAGEMERLGAQHPPARERFAAFRDAAGEKIAGEKVDPEDLDDWVVLNGVVGEPEKTLEWFDRVKADARWRPLVQRVSFRLEQLLMERERWADIALIYPDPVAKLRQEHQLKQMTDAAARPGVGKEQQERMKATYAKMFRDKAGKLHAALLAADREKEAKELADEAVKLDDTGAMRVALVQWALKADEARMYHVQYAQEAEGKSDVVVFGSLRKEVAKKLFPGK